MNNYRVVDVYELVDFIANETDEEVLAAMHILDDEGDNAFWLKKSFLEVNIEEEDIDFV
tara:strand:+ start:1532 stop:1708 length:177 start_codon:yes stop_codon:yes gene_type:complete